MSSCTVAAALSHVGVNEDPPGSNCQPFSRALGRPCEAWCADGFCYCDHVDCGLDFAWLGLGATGTASCRVMTVAAQRAGRFGSVPRVDAAVMFGAGGGSHVERVIRVRAVLPDGTQVEVDAGEAPAGSRPVAVYCVGFNTSAPSNYAGGTVKDHWRALGPGDDIYGYVYPPYSDAPAPPIDMEDFDMADAIVMVRNDNVPNKTAWAVLVTGEGPCGMRKLAMGDAKDLRNRPDGYGPPVEVDPGQLRDIPLPNGHTGDV